LEVFAEARRKALHAAYYKTPIASIIPNNAAAAGSSSNGGSFVPLDDTVNDFIENDYVENYFE
jgi:hypothetical protein